MDWEPVIGLEIHVQLNTLTKLFSGASNRFGDEPNTNISAICTGQPGTLPVLNKAAVKKAVQLGCAIGSDVALISHFDRKSYFYPDSPRNFQITQFAEPILRGGKVVATIENEAKVFTIDRAHLEDDAGMLKHFTSFAGVDYNRAGSALIEIVSEPCIHSSKEAVAYAMAIRDILLYLDVSDCNMEEGSLRMDVNISVRPKGSKELRNRIEIKNLNSFSYMQMAIEKEVERQIKLYRLNPDASYDSIIPRATYRFDTEKKETIMMRQKEMAEDYRYFPEPDLPPLVIDKRFVEQIKEELPELPREKRLRFIEKLQLSEQLADTLIGDKSLCYYFEEALTKGTNPKSLCTWIIIEFPGRLKELGKTMRSSGIPPKHVAMLVEMQENGKVTGKIAKAIADLMVLHPEKTPEQLADENPEFKPVSDTSTLEILVDDVLKNNPQSILDYKAGRDKAFAFLVGQVMKQTKGAASPQIVNELLKKKIEKL